MSPPELNVASELNVTFKRVLTQMAPHTFIILTLVANNIKYLPDNSKFYINLNRLALSS